MRGGSLLRFRCHTGHAFTAQNLLAAQAEATEAALWATIRSYQERVMLLRQLAKTAGEKDEVMSSARWIEQADTAQEVVDQLKRFKNTN